MTKLSDFQLVILTTAAQRSGHLALPLPSNLRGAAIKLVGAMIAKGLLAEVYADKGGPLSHEAGDGRGMTLVATDAGLAAIGAEPEAANSAPTGAQARRHLQEGRGARAGLSPNGRLMPLGAHEMKSPSCGRRRLDFGHAALNEIPSLGVVGLGHQP